MTETSQEPRVGARIAIDLLAVRSWGMKNYTMGVLPALAALAPQDRFLVLLRPEIAELVTPSVPANVEVRTLDAGVIRRLFWEQIVLPWVLARWRADVLFATFDIAPVLAPCPILLAVRNPSPAIVHDRAARRSVGDYLTARIHSGLSYWSCRRSRLVFYPTQFAADLLGDVMQLPARKRRVVHHGSDREDLAVRRDPQLLDGVGVLPGRYVLYVSGFYPYKHPEVLLDAFASFLCTPGGQGFKLVLVGADLLIANAKRVVEDRLRQQAIDLGVADAVIFAGQVSRDQLAALYQHAIVFALPTVMETFGLVFVEAMASGTPVLCADTPFAREICGDAARYFPPGDHETLASQLAVVVSDGAERARMSVQGRERADRFSWQREAHETYQLLREVLCPS